MTDPASDKILLVLVGLPARGKSYVAHKLSAFMQWKGIACKSFNVGALRRKAVHEKQTADFFSGDNEDAKQKREAVALEVLHSALEWLSTGGGSIAILDATNTTRRRRTRVQQSVVDFFSGTTAHLPYVVFVECICNNETVLASNMLQKVTNSPDYRYACDHCAGRPTRQSGGV
jgi:tRNA uridine 5-carbamoylmethylation protein Kti12